MHHRQSFLKAEVQIPPSYEEPLASKAPRLIQGLLTPEMNIVTGPFFKFISESLSAPFLEAADSYSPGMRNWPRYGYTSGTTPEILGEWFGDMKDAGFRFLEDDFSAYDSTQGEGCWEIENFFYRTIPGFPDAKQAFVAQRDTFGFSRYHSYKCHYTRKSGDQNTSIGNTLVNFVAHGSAIKSFATIHGIEIEFYMIGLGDDNLIALRVPRELEAGLLVHVEQHIREMGLVPKLKWSNVAPTYCSSEFIPVHDEVGQDKWLLSPSPLRIMCKQAFCTEGIRTKDIDMRLKGNLLGSPVTEYMPVLSAFFSHYTNLSGEATRQNGAFDIVVRGKYSQSERTFGWFREVYGLDRGDIGELESFIVSMLALSSNTPCLWYHPLVDRMIAFRESKDFELCGTSCY